MNQKISITVILFICIISNLLFAQSNTFERSYPDFEMSPAVGLKTIELPDNEYLVLNSPIYWQNVILMKIDQNGYTVWRKEIETLQTDYPKTNQVLLTKQNEILLMTVQKSDDLVTLNLKKYDLNGDETFSTNLITDSSIIGCAITKTEDDDYLLSYIQSGSRPPINLIKTDSQFNIFWQKKIYAVTPSMIETEFFIKKWGLNNFAIGYKSQYTENKFRWRQHLSCKSKTSFHFRDSRRIIAYIWK